MSNKKELPLTIRQKKFCKYVALTGKVHESALRAGYKQPNQGSILKRDPRIQTAIQKEMDKIGLTDKFLATRIKEGCDAEVPEKMSKEGKVLQQSYPDFYNRKDYIKMALQVKGDLKPDFPGGRGDTINITLNLKAVDGLLDAEAITIDEYEEIKDAEEITEIEDKRDRLLEEQAGSPEKEDSV